MGSSFIGKCETKILKETAVPISRSGEGGISLRKAQAGYRTIRYQEPLNGRRWKKVETGDVKVKKSIKSKRNKQKAKHIKAIEKLQYLRGESINQTCMYGSFCIKT